jgi:hypothetical protein
MRAGRWLCLLLLVCSACDREQDTAGDEALATATAVASEERALPEGVALPPPRTFDNNPLGLPDASKEVPKGARVFTVPRAMLDRAKLGSSFELRAAIVDGVDGTNLLVHMRGEAPFAAHPAYVVVAEPGRIGMGTLLIAPYGGVLRHAVGKNLFRDKIVVRFTDLGRKPSDRKLSPNDIGVLPEGRLAPGSFAIHRDEHERKHVTLVSVAKHPDGKERWLVLGYAGEAKLVESSELESLPPRRFRPKVGDNVLALWRGGMVPAMLREIDHPGIYTVKRPRTGAPLTLGPGMIMPAPPEPANN